MIIIGKPPSGSEADPAQVESLVTPLVEGVATEKSRAVVDEFSSGVASFAELRTRQPRYEGERVMLREYAPGTGVRYCGGGWFTGRLVAQADDGGYVASSGAAWHWKREKELTDLTILDFGGVPDGVSDTSPAVKRMYEFMFGTFARSISGALSPYLGVQMTAGTFFMSPLSLTTYGNNVPSGAADAGQNPTGYYGAGDFRLMGAPVKFGKQIATKIISDKSDNPCLTINHRRFTIHGITWDGQQTTAQDKYNADTNPNGTNMLVGATLGVFNDTASNKQPFFKNICPGGVYGNITCFNSQNAGSYGIYWLDSLDSRIDQCYSSKTAGPVFQVGWSDPLNQWTGKWDHSTALEISNCNFQSNYAPALWVPRHGQGILRNVWIEHGTTPLDINNGQWNIDMLCIEDCRQPAVMYYTRQTTRTYSNPTGVLIDTTTPPSSPLWASYPKNPDGSDIVNKQSAYELGTSRFENYGTYLDNPLRYKWMSGVIRGANNTAGNVWLNVGSFYTPAVGGGWEIEIICRNGYSSIGTPPLDVSSDRTLGKTIINVQRGSGLSPIINMYHFGASGVVAARYQSQAYNDTLPALWLNLSSYCGEYSISVKSTGVTRLEAGQCSLFNVNGATQTTDPGTLNQIEGRFSLHNGLAGYGAQGSVAAVKTTRATPTNAPVEATPVLYMRMNINGQEMAVPVYAYVPRFTTSNPATLSVAAGSPLTLSPVVVDAVSQQWQKSTDSGSTWANISGATAQTLTIASAAAGDAGQYRLAVRSNNGSGGAGTTTFGPVTTVTIT